MYMHKKFNIYCRFTFLVVKIFLHVRRDMKIILMKIYSMKIRITSAIFTYALKHEGKYFHLKFYYVKIIQVEKVNLR